MMLAILLERMPIPLSQGSLSLSFAFILCTFYVFGNVIIPVWIASTGIFLSQLVFHKRKILHALFNVGIIATSTMVGGYVFKFLGGTWEFPIQINLFIIAFMVVSILAVNHIILGFYFKIVDPNFNLPRLFNDVKWDGMTYLITVPLGILMAFAYDYGLTGVMILFAPLATSSYIFRLYKKVDEINRQLNGLHDVVIEINANLELKKIMDNVGEHLFDLLKLNSFYIFLLENNALKALYGKGEMVPYLETKTVEIGQGATGYCVKHKVTVLIQDSTKDERIFSPDKAPKGSAVLAVPMIRQGEVIGALTAVRNPGNKFSKTDVLILEIMASQTAVAIDNAKTFKEIESQAIVDDLTKVYNYRYFQQKIRQEIEKAALGGTHTSLMIIDLDDFKRINDTYGHAMGNKVLIELSQILRKSIRQYDLLFRYGGDEFVILFPNTDKKTAEKIGQRILESVNEAIFGTSEGIEESLTFSAGIAEFPTDADDHQDLIRKTDRTMYVGSKEKGKNRVAIYSKKEA